MDIQTTKATSQNAPETKKCPMCAEQILLEAKKCKHCGEQLDRSEMAQESARVAVIASPQPLVMESLPMALAKKIFPFSLNVVKGKLELAGKGTWLSSESGNVASIRYSVIQISGKKYRNVYIRDNVGSFLDTAVGDEIELMIAQCMGRSYGIAIRTKMGVEKSGIILGVSAILSFGSCAFWGIGLPFLVNNFVRMWKFARF